MPRRGDAPAAGLGATDEETTTASEQASGDASDGPGVPGRHRRYGVLLALLIASYLLSAFLGRNDKWISDLQLGLFTLVGLMSIRNSAVRRSAARLIACAGLVVSLLMIILAIHLDGHDGRAVASIWTGLLLLFTVINLVRQVLALPVVTVQSIYGVISAYLIIGLMFATFYSAMYWLSGTFFAGNQPVSTSNFQYFSFTTLTTLGYGDFTAAQSAGRAVAMIEAMTGQIFLATLVAKLVASYRSSDN